MCQGLILNPLRETYPAPEKFPLVRLYAKDVDGAFRLVEDLAENGYGFRSISCKSS